MKNRLQPCSSLERPIPRRKFLAQTAAAASLTIVPRRVLGGINYVAPSDKLDISVNLVTDMVYIQQLRKAGYVADGKVTVTK